MAAATEKPHYHVTAGLIWKEGQLLISKRPEGAHLEGFWEFPGGKQEPGEGLEECLEREIAEELGIQVRVDGALVKVAHEYAEKRISLHVFNCTWVRGEPAARQCQAFKWVIWNDLSGLPFPPPDTKVIDIIEKRCNKKMEETSHVLPKSR